MTIVSDTSYEFIDKSDILPVPFGGPISKIRTFAKGAKYLGIGTGKVGNKVLSRYFSYTTRSRSRTIGTATGAGLGIGGGVVAILTKVPKTKTGSVPKARNYVVKYRPRFRNNSFRSNPCGCC